MGIKITDKSEVIGIWFAGTDGLDFLATLAAEEGVLEGAVRLRLHLDDKAFDSEDIKKGYQIGPMTDTPEARQENIDLMEQAWQYFKAAGLSDQEAKFLGGTGKEAMEWLLKQPFVQTETVPKDGH